MDAAYIVGLEARGLSPCARRYMQTGKVKVTEWTNYCLSARFRAAAMGVPFIPTRNLLGTDTFEYSGSRLLSARTPARSLLFSRHSILTWPSSMFMNRMSTGTAESVAFSNRTTTLPVPPNGRSLPASD